MPELNIDITSDTSPSGIAGELRALKLALGLLAAKIPVDHNPQSVPESLRSTGDKHAANLADVLESFINEARAQK